MADPLTWLTVTSGVLGVVGSISQGEQTSANAKNQARAAEYNAKQGMANAQTALETGNANEEAQRRRARTVLGTQKAGLAQSGLDIDTGTGAGVFEQSALNAELDALNIRYDAQRQSDALKTGAAMDLNTAATARANASNARTAGYINAGTAGLTSFNNYLSYQTIPRLKGNANSKKTNVNITD